jgi:hypothetical protein
MSDQGSLSLSLSLSQSEAKKTQIFSFEKVGMMNMRSSMI